jgi:hypothetical protein
LDSAAHAIQPLARNESKFAHSFCQSLEETNNVQVPEKAPEKAGWSYDTCNDPLSNNTKTKKPSCMTDEVYLQPKEIEPSQTIIKCYNGEYEFRSLH